MSKKDLLEGRTKEWDSNDWQGKSKEQVEFSEKIVFISLICLGIFVIALMLYH